MIAGSITSSWENKGRSFGHGEIKLGWKKRFMIFPVRFVISKHYLVGVYDVDLESLLAEGITLKPPKQEPSVSPTRVK